MARRKSGTKRAAVEILSFILLIVVFLVARNLKEDDAGSKKPGGDISAGNVYVRVIDVGQGSSALIQRDDEGVLIDAGERDQADNVISVLRSYGIKKLKYVIASHPHSDHIGAMADVLDVFETENVIMPRLSESNTPTH